jgi:hypothetical protein
MRGGVGLAAKGAAGVGGAQDASTRQAIIKDQ